MVCDSFEFSTNPVDEPDAKSFNRPEFTVNSVCIPSPINYECEVPLKILYNDSTKISDRITSRMSISESVATHLACGSVLGVILGHQLKKSGKLIAGFAGLFFLINFVFWMAGWISVNAKMVRNDLFTGSGRWNSWIANALEKIAVWSGILGGGYLGFINTLPYNWR